MAPAASAGTVCTADQMVVSVGPYMFIRDPGTSAASSRASDGGKASPPTIIRRSAASPGRAASSCTSMRAIDGVHCRCVTSCRCISAASDAPSPATAGGVAI